MKKVIVKDIKGLDEEVISKIKNPMIYIKDYIENNTLFVELKNSKTGEIIRIFPERIIDYKSLKY